LPFGLIQSKWVKHILLRTASKLPPLVSFGFQSHLFSNIYALTFISCLLSCVRFIQPKFPSLTPLQQQYSSWVYQYTTTALQYQCSHGLLLSLFPNIVFTASYIVAEHRALLQNPGNQTNNAL
jgi:hypothetical protein